MQHRKKTKKEKIAAHLKQLEKEKLESGKESFMYSGICIAISAFMLWTLVIARTSIIANTTLFAISFITLLFISTFYYLISNKDILFFWKDIQLTICSTIILCLVLNSLILFINYIPFSTTYTTTKVRVIKWETRKPKRGSRYPVAKIKYYGHTSTLSFSQYSLSQVIDKDSLKIKIRKGNLGFGYVETYSLATGHQ